MTAARRRAAGARRRAVATGLGLAAVGAAVGGAVVAARRHTPAGESHTPVGESHTSAGESHISAGESRTAGRRAVLPREEIAQDTEGHRGGSGTPLLLLHGLSVTWRTWKPVLPLLERHHDVIAPTLLGHSGAAPLAEGTPASVAALVDGVEAELDRLGLGTVHVAGNSLGGWIALELARRGRARSVVAFSPGGGFTANLRMAAVVRSMSTTLRLVETHGHRLERLAWTERGRRLLAWSQFEHPERADPLELIADIRAIRQAPVIKPLLRVLLDHPFEPLPDPRCPVRIVWARRDRVIPFKHHGRPMLERVPAAELIVLDGVGHVPMPDDPEAVARLITEVTYSVDRLRARPDDQATSVDDRR